MTMEKMPMPKQPKKEEKMKPEIVELTSEMEVGAFPKKPDYSKRPPIDIEKLRKENLEKLKIGALTLEGEKEREVKKIPPEVLKMFTDPKTGKVNMEDLRRYNWKKLEKGGQEAEI